MKLAMIWSREELLTSGLHGVQRHRWFIGRDKVSGYALIDGNIMEEIYHRLTSSAEQYDMILEYR